MGLTYRSAISVDESSKLGHQGAKKIGPNGSTMGGLCYEGNSSLEHAGEANNMSQLIQVRYFPEHRRGEFTAYVERRDSHDPPCKNEWIARCYGLELCSFEAALVAPAGERPQNRPKMGFRSLSCSQEEFRRHRVHGNVAKNSPSLLT